MIHICLHFHFVSHSTIVLLQRIEMQKNLTTVTDALKLMTLTNLRLLILKERFSVTRLHVVGVRVGEL